MLAVLQAYCLVKHQFIGDDSSKVRKQREAIKEALKDYVLSEADYEKVRDVLNKEMDKGLNRSTNKDAIVKMLPTYVRSLPDGSERGDFLALDLGGTNFRVLLITLKGAQVEMKNKIYPISEVLMQGHGEKLFDYIVECIGDFMKEQKLSGHSKLPLGFTFSFPCAQEGLNVGRLLQWTKGFACEGVEGEDVVRLLHEAIGRRPDIDVECVALLNDTVGCLMSCAFLDHNCEIGVILGTGSNACFMERLERVQTWDGDRGEPKQVVINTEWGAFGSDGTLDWILCPADKEIDRESLNPGKQIFEKMISGMYMGEIARLIITNLANQKLIFNGKLSDKIKEKHRFYTKFVSEIEDDTESEDFPKTTEILNELDIHTFTPEDCRTLRYVCQLVSRRAAFLASAGIACLLNRISKPNVTVAVDGSLYRFHPHFHTLMMDKIKALINPGLKFSLMLSEDGSGKGAALVAAVAARLRREAEAKAKN